MTMMVPGQVWLDPGLHSLAAAVPDESAGYSPWPGFGTRLNVAHPSEAIRCAYRQLLPAAPFDPPLIADLLFLFVATLYHLHYTTTIPACQEPQSEPALDPGLGGGRHPMDSRRILRADGPLSTLACGKYGIEARPLLQDWVAAVPVRFIGS